MFRKIGFLMAALLTGLVVSAADELKILTVGNSFADSAFRYLPKVAESAGCKILMDRANLGGCPLDRHWKLVEANEKNPADKAYHGKKYSLKDMLQKEKWDIVTVQQASHLSWKPESYEPYLTNLIDYIRKYAPTAEIVIQQTWAYRFDDNRYKGWKIGQQEMYDKLTQAYRKAAEEHKLRVIPTGYAVQLGRGKQPVKYQPYDPASLKGLKYHDALPSEAGSWVTGLSWWKRKDGWKLHKDPAHLNRRGDYLQACVWFALLYNRPTSEIKFVPKEVTPEDAKFIRDLAQEAVDTYKQVETK